MGNTPASGYAGSTGSYPGGHGGADLNLSPSTVIIPRWPAPPHITAAVTTRSGGVSAGNYTSFNLAQHVDDDKEQVAKNRELLTARLELVRPIQWLDQVHGVRVAVAPCAEATPQADALYTRTPGQACAVLTADCLPVLLCSASGDEVAVAHAGWRGLADGVLEATVRTFSCAPEQLLVWLGPAISQRHFQVGSEVRQEFLDRADSAHQARLISAAFLPSANQEGYFQADLYQLARLRLQYQGVQKIYGGEFCTYAQPDYFYSYRRDKTTGRMATVILINPVR